jgi:hypothetical protein
MEPEIENGTRVESPVGADVTTPIESVPQPESPPQPQYQHPEAPSAYPFPAVPPAAYALQPPAPSHPFPRTRALIAGGAVLSIAIGAGIGTYVVQQRQHRNDQAIAAAQAAQAAKPQPVTAGVRADGSHYGTLFAYLLPMPDGYTLGPYDANYGNNSYVSAAQITTQLEDLLSGIPKSDMSTAKGALANTHLKGVAVRTLENSSNSSVVISIELLQFDVKDAKSAAASFTSLVSDLNVFRNGPSVPGYGQAKCVLPPGLGSDQLDEMLCVASSGDIEVMVDAQGETPLAQNEIATLVGQQLDRLKTSQTIDPRP